VFGDDLVRLGDHGFHLGHNRLGFGAAGVLGRLARFGLPTSLQFEDVSAVPEDGGLPPMVLARLEAVFIAQV
jgi:hypothetical protein